MALDLYHFEMGLLWFNATYVLLDGTQSSGDSSVSMFFLTVVSAGIADLPYYIWLYVGSRLSNSSPHHHIVNVVSTGPFLSVSLEVKSI